jgi:REP element-mobilizing transposase RayT
MPRPPRLHVPGGFYHVTLRGNHQEALFASPQDRSILNGFVAEAIEKYQARIHAFCWMTNHLHAFIQIGEVKLGKVVGRFAVRYSRYRHKQLRTKGHLFDRRHQPYLVDSDAYFLSVLRYIHLNPVSARMVESPDEYEWSSHRAYLGIETLPWLTTEFGLGLLGKALTGARNAYDSLMRGDLDADPGFNLVPSDDPRVIGTDRFLASLPPPQVKPRSRLSLEQLALDVCMSLNVSLDAVRSPSRDRRLTPARVQIAGRATDERIASHHSVARFLGRSPSAIGQLLKRRATG